MLIENKNRLSYGRLLARNVVWNLLGGSVPILVAIVAVPMIIRSLGTERFGVLTFAWLVIGYFSLFDLGLGRALTQKVAEKLGTGQEEDIPALVWISILLMIIFGLVGMTILGLLSHSLVHHFLKIPQSLQAESLRAFVLLALSVPIVISTVGLRGILEAHQQFGFSNVVRTSMGVLTFAGPLFPRVGRRPLMISNGIEASLNLQLSPRETWPQAWVIFVMRDRRASLERKKT